MTRYRLEPSVNIRLDEIHAYSCAHWGQERGDRYIRDLFERFESIARRETIWRAIPSELGAAGHFCRHAHHYIYWKQTHGRIAIFAILHERMHQGHQLASALEP